MLAVEGLTVRYGDHVALDAVDLEVAAGETVAVLGPSGSGKSTLLRAVAGLEPAAAGIVRWAGEDLARVPPHRRRFGLMFQDYALFPHRDVRGNVEFGLRMAGTAPGPRARRVTEVLETVGLADLGDRRVATLSGGEQQRVALARALAPSPRLLMLDEPLGSLDRTLRERLVDELRGLLARAGLPALYVTHDQDEAFALADRVAILRGGRLVQAGTPAEVWRAPADAATARFLGFGPTVRARRDGDRLVTPWGDASRPETARLAGGAVTVVVGPGALRPAADGPLAAVVEDARFAGARSRLRVRVGDGPPLLVERDEPAAPGDVVRLRLDPDRLLVYPDGEDDPGEGAGAGSSR